MFFAVLLYVLCFTADVRGIITNSSHADLFRILGHLYCGNQRVTGVLDIVKGSKVLKSCQVTNNSVTIKHDIKERLPYWVGLDFRTPCGVISREGTCCDHKFKLTAYSPRGRAIMIQNETPINITNDLPAENLLERIKLGHATLICTDTDPKACQPIKYASNGKAYSYCE
ncbi:hypothetical protein DdX_06701 [Ditylenchus destructor]|uniref:Uncharacterized protein n=1 Tax=Ditylenchus destructor TaxID=166010 RepID=A0AAD4R9C8_9BILA|nr:hypothetical protein DdX_06701 [Ditylenchus destructor]